MQEEINAKKSKIRAVFIRLIILAFLVPVVCLRIIKNRFRILFIAQIITNITIIIVLVFYFVFLAGAN